MSAFTLTHTDPSSRARAGTLRTAHGVIETPVFMPVGTQASVKAVMGRDLEEMGTQILLGNTYHLFLRPRHGGDARVRRPPQIHELEGGRSSRTAAGSRSSAWPSSGS